ncbi:MAG: DNA-directed RNA polymerase subunit beta' [Myxococcota bacterium]
MKEMFTTFEKPRDPLSVEAFRVALASPKKILEWSHGEVKKPETINYRTFKPERDGLFCAKIFGPVKDYECNCGRYKRLKHRGIVCEKCGVEVIQSKVRRERMGHIVLSSPVAHIWFLKSIPSRIGHVLDITLKDLEKVLYCVAYVVVDPGDLKDELQKNQVVSEDRFDQLWDEYYELHQVEPDCEVGMGAEAIRKLLEGVDVVSLADEIREELKEVTADARRKKLAKRLKVVEALRDSGNRPEWMVLKNLPVLPPDLRPLVPLEGGRFATSDLNDLYRRVINRNNRLKKLMELNAPEIIIRNEKRMLQEAVDALFDNGRRGKVITGTNRRPLKSLSDMLKGKQGRFRQNLLGKRVDYSGRSVIVVGPELRLHQCGLPKKMALELFKPFIFNKLEERGFATTIKTAKKQVEEEDPVVWDILEEVSKEHPVLLNRAPTLHRLGMQAFEPVLIEGKAIQLHPLVCAAYNADFDGDQMAVHLPLSLESQVEARVLMMSSNNILKPADGRAIITPSQDIVLGIYYLTREKPFARGEGRSYSSPAEVRVAYDAGELDLQARIKVRISLKDSDGNIVKTKLYNTTTGRVLLSELVPPTIPFEFCNKVLDKKSIANIIDETYRRCGSKDTVLLADQIRTIGYKHATKAGISIATEDMLIPKEKEAILEEAQNLVTEIDTQYHEGAITQGERYNKVIDAWSSAADKVASKMMEGISKEVVERNGEKQTVPSSNPIFIMADSGARGSAMQMRQLAGMRGLMARPSGEIMETPIKANFREGLTVLEYFMSTHGARKGLADTALKTANAGYLTRRLVDVAQDVVVTEYDCRTLNGIEVTALDHDGNVRVPLEERILGRVALEEIVDPYDQNHVIVEANQEIDEDKVKEIIDAGITAVKVRSVLSCRTRNGCCVLCYGRDLARGKLVNIGEAVGVIAAQSIGEPGTQLTMRTFHIGGTASVAELSKWEVNAEGVLEFPNLLTVKRLDGTLISMEPGEILWKETSSITPKTYKVPRGAVLHFESGSTVTPKKEGEGAVGSVVIASWDPWSHPILTEVAGVALFEDIIDGVTVKESPDVVPGLSVKVINVAANTDARPAISVCDLVETISNPKRKGVEVITVDGKRKVIKTSAKEGKPQILHEESDRVKIREIDQDKEKEIRVYEVKTIPGTKRLAAYLLPQDAHIYDISDMSEVNQGDVLSRVPKGTTKMKDITGGLPRVTELFEARKPKEHAIISEIDGELSFGKPTKGKRKLIVTPELGEKKEYLVPKGKYVSLREGDTVKAGDALMEGSVNPHDLLKVKGIEALAKYLVDEVQEVYRLQSVRIQDKHIETIVRQMLRWMKITDPGDTKFLEDEQVDRWAFEEENAAVLARGGQHATGEPILLGITKASLNVESFISSASFQETTRVLTEAAISGKTDYLRGLKENVIMGRLIPAGTGFPLLNKRVEVKVVGGSEYEEVSPTLDLSSDALLADFDDLNLD